MTIIVPWILYYLLAGIGFVDPERCVYAATDTQGFGYACTVGSAPSAPAPTRGRHRR